MQLEIVSKTYLGYVCLPSYEIPLLKYSCSYSKWCCKVFRYILLHLGNSCNVIEVCVRCVCCLWKRSVHKTVTLDLRYDSILAVIIELPYLHLQHLSALKY